MEPLKLKPTSASVKAYYETLQKFGKLEFDNEGNLRRAFEALIEKCAKQFGWTVVPEYPITRKGQHPLRVDAAVLDAFNLPRGYWEAKDSKDDLRAEMEKKFAAGYPRTNILFQSPARAILFQNGHIEFDDDITDPVKLVDVLRRFFEWQEQHIAEWDRAVEEFSSRIPDIARGAMKLIEDERKSNRAFVERFTAFAEVCRESINPDLRDEAVEEMLVQHLLTERIFRRIFDNPEFTRRNVIAAEIEKVIDSLTKKYFSRDQFLKPLDPFYKAIEEAASQTETYTEKQAFLNRVYERFFQGFSKKQADTHGIVYTPQPIVDFMVRSVEEVLKTEFGKSLSDENVHILDPFVGTGNFITRIMQQIKTSKLPQKYKNELHCNEVMLLPYYIASMNIEHAYLDRTGEYEPFEGICLVDTFELAEPKQAGFEFMTEGNTERIRRQKKAPIFVVIGNPPYNMGQVNENDQNKNRKYKHMDKRVQETYTKASKATLRNKLSDPYVKAFRLASDRIRAGGVIAFVSNNSFVDNIAFDGMRKYLAQEFDKIYVLDLGGNVRKNPKLSGTTHNVFGIQVGVAITVLVKAANHSPDKKAEIHYASTDKDWRKEQKYEQLNDWEQISSVQWQEIQPDQKSTWLTEGQQEDFTMLLPLGNKKTKDHESTETIFRLFSLGIVSARDAYVFNSSRKVLEHTMRQCIHAYTETLTQYRQANPKPKPDVFIHTSDTKIKWSRQTKTLLGQLEDCKFSEGCLRIALYRPYFKQWHYFQDFWNEERYQLPRLWPKQSSLAERERERERERENFAICVNQNAGIKGFHCLSTDCIPDFHLTGDSQCFPFYTYDEDGTNRRENITDWALAQFQKHYHDDSITKWDIFHATYAVLHHPEYRSRYAANLKRELPRIPFVPEFHQYAEIGRRLMEIHIHYERQPEYPLERIENGKLDWRVEKMALSKDKTELRYNGFLTLRGIPPEVYEYRLGNRSALEWVVDQYRVSRDACSGIVNDPNRKDNPEYIVRLIGQVVTVSMETVKLVRRIGELLLL
jgi:predicted helicase